MRSALFVVSALLAVLGTMCLGIALSDPAGAPEKLAGSMVKIVVGEEGTCSGVHIGGGNILTAAHCAEGEKFTVKSDDGMVEKPATVMWASIRFDIALMRANIAGAVASSELACRAIKVGDDVRVDGNPMGWSWISVWGRVAGAQLAFLTWPEVIPLDVTGGPGDSGGPVYDANGAIVGIVVAGYNTGFPLRSFMLVVPGPTICRLLAK